MRFEMAANQLELQERQKAVAETRIKTKVLLKGTRRTSRICPRLIVRVKYLSVINIWLKVLEPAQV